MTHNADVCFWCGETTNIINPEYAKEGIVHGYDPCVKCQEKWNSGILCMEVDLPEKLGRPPLGTKGMERVMATTGRWAIIQNEQLDELTWIHPPLRDQIILSRKMIIEPLIYDMIFHHDTLKDV